MNKAKEHKTEFVTLVKSVSVECTCYVSVQSNSSDIWLTWKQRVEDIIGTKKERKTTSNLILCSKVLRALRPYVSSGILRHTSPPWASLSKEAFPRDGGYEGGDCPIPKTQSPYLLCLSKEKPMTEAEQVSRSVHYTLHLGHQWPLHISNQCNTYMSQAGHRDGRPLCT